jgi:hypothetical protein
VVGDAHGAEGDGGVVFVPIKAGVEICDFLDDFGWEHGSGSFLVGECAPVEKLGKRVASRDDDVEIALAEDNGDVCGKEGEIARDVDPDQRRVRSSASRPNDIMHRERNLK